MTRCRVWRTNLTPPDNRSYISIQPVRNDGTFGLPWVLFLEDAIGIFGEETCESFTNKAKPCELSLTIL